MRYGQLRGKSLRHAGEKELLRFCLTFVGLKVGWLQPTTTSYLPSNFPNCGPHQSTPVPRPSPPPLFREAFQRRRGLVVADGFYEWKKDGNTKTPYFIHLRTRRPFGFAAIWSSTRTAMGQRVGTCAILTCAPNELMAPIHNRMPVILSKGARERWLEPGADARELQALLTPFPPDEMEAYAVSTLVNSPRNDTAECIVPVSGLQ
jgi:SOS response associated peptidase (SRAP)